MTTTKQAKNLRTGDIIRVSDTLTRSVEYVHNYMADSIPMTDIHFFAGTVLTVPSRCRFKK